MCLFITNEHDMLQEAGKKSEDPSWRKRPARLVTFGSGLDDNAVVTPAQSPERPLDMRQLNEQSRPWFRFGVPGAQFLSFEGPGGDTIAHGVLQHSL